MEMYIVTLARFSSLATPEDVKITTSYAANDKQFHPNDDIPVSVCTDI